MCVNSQLQAKIPPSSNSKSRGTQSSLDTYIKSYKPQRMIVIWHNREGSLPSAHIIHLFFLSLSYYFVFLLKGWWNFSIPKWFTEKQETTANWSYHSFFERPKRFAPSFFLFAFWLCIFYHFLPRKVEAFLSCLFLTFYIPSLLQP